MNWINVKDRMPDDGQDILCASKMDGGMWWFGCCKYQGFFPWAKYGSTDSVEFWMPIPEPPYL